MAERSLLDKLINPTQDEKDEIITGIKEGQKFINIVREEGIEGLAKRLAEEKLKEEGVPERKIRKRGVEVEEFLDQDKSVIGQTTNFILDSTDRADKQTILDDGTAPPEVEVVERSVGIPEDEFNEIATSQSIGAGVASGIIKIPKGLVNFGTLLYDVFQEEGIPVDQSLTQKFNDAFENSYLGIIEKAAEDQANQTASGRILEALTQIYGATSIAGKTTIPAVTYLTQKARQLATPLVNAIKGNKYVKTTGNKNLLNAGKKADELNKASGFDKFVGVAVGGGIGAGALVAKVEDIGTFGDFIDFIPTELDRKENPDAAEDAARQLHNKFLFGTEFAFPIIPFVYGVGKTGKLIATKGKDLAFSNSAIERWIDRWIGQPFRSRSSKAQAIHDGVVKLEGTKAALKVTADDFAKSMDESLKKISRETKKVGEAVDPAVASKTIADFMLKTKDAVKKGNIYFEGFNPKVVKDFTASMKKLGISNDTIDKIIGDAVDFRTVVADLKNGVLQGGNINQGSAAFNDIMTDRVTKFLQNDYKIFDLNKGIFDGYIPTREAFDQITSIIQRYAKNNGVTLNEGRAREIVNNIYKNVQFNPIDKAPVFPLGTKNILDDKGVIMKNISENITAGGKFKPDGKGGLIQTKSDLDAFRSFFGEYKDAKKIIYNIMGDLGEIQARDKFYNYLKTANNIQIQRGERGIFRSSYDEAVQAFPNKEILTAPTGLKLKNRLSDEVYTSPIDGLFTTKEWADAIRIGDELVSSGLTKSAAYRYLLLLPKGITQIAKTVLGPLTHARNFTSAFVTTIHRGNLFIDPREMLKYMGRSMQSIQPQILYKLTGNPRFRNTEQGQQLYKFLLEEGVVNQGTTFRDATGIIEDIQKFSGAGIDTFVNKTFNTLTRPFKAAYRIAADAYIAEDDFFRIYNFLAESYKLDRAFDSAIKRGIRDASGKLIKKPNPLEIWKEAAGIVRETVPNYAYVSDFVKGVRRSPLGNFASFPAEIFRTSGNTTQRGIREIKDPVRESIGYRSLIGQGITYAAVPAVAYEAIRGLYGISREVAKAIREFVPGWSDDNTLLPIVEDGKYKYIDFSHGFFYDTVTGPVQSVIANVDVLDEKPLMEGLTKGFIKAIANTMEPFISESIFFGAMADLFIRNGEDENGIRVFNPRDSFGDKIYKSIRHVAYKLSPGSYPQLKRLYAASADKTIKGTQYEIPDELLGFFGARKVPLDIPKTMGFKIQQFKTDERDERGLIFEGLLTGDPVTDTNKIIEQFIFANKQRLDTFNKMRRTIDAAKVLGMRNREIQEMFVKRGLGPSYEALIKNRFRPFKITSGYRRAFEDLSKEKLIPNPLDRRTERTLQRIIRELERGQRLNQDFIINVEDYLIDKSDVSMLTPPLSNEVLSAQPSNQVIQTASIAPVDESGLTAVEKALYDEGEKQITLRNRGLIT